MGLKKKDTVPVKNASRYTCFWLKVTNVFLIVDVAFVVVAIVAVVVVVVVAAIDDIVVAVFVLPPLPVVVEVVEVVIVVIVVVVWHLTVPANINNNIMPISRILVFLTLCLSCL